MVSGCQLDNCLFQNGSIFVNLKCKVHSDLNDQNLFHSTIDTPPGVSKNLEDQTEDNFGELKG